MRWIAFWPAAAGLLVLTAVSAPAAEAPFGLTRRLPCDTSRLSGTPEPPPPYRTRRVFERMKFNQPVHLLAEPTSQRLLVVEQLGRIVAFANDPKAEKGDVFLALPDHETFGMTFHPDYARNRQVFIFANGPQSATHPRYNRIYRFEVARDGGQRCDPKSKKLVIEWASNGHNGGDLLFGKDGYLYITSGDGTSDSDGDVTGQDLRDLCSGVLRLDVDHPEPGKGYAVPKDNPFVHVKDARPELFAFGFRNPWRMAMDPATGTILIGDVGQDLWEMIQILKRGGNYGWSVFEGSHPFYPNRTLGPGPRVLPLIEHPHSESRSITGGQFYRGRFSELHGAYVYGDYATGKVWALRQGNGKVIWQKELANTRLQTVGFGMDQAGDLYLVDYGGQIHTLEPNPPPRTKTSFPRKLSETGLFASVANHQPSPGLIPYSVNSPLWSDGAAKVRFIALPGQATIEFTEAGAWRLPENTVLVKTFSLEREEGKRVSRRRIETRLLVFFQGEWQGYSYQWNEDQTDANLVPPGGADKAFVVAERKAPGGIRRQTWHYPSRVECMVCHSRAAGFVLGLSAMQMNKVHDYGGIKDNQLRSLEHIGAFRVNWTDHLSPFESSWREFCQTASLFLPPYLRERAAKPVRDRIQAAWGPQRTELAARLSAAPKHTPRLPRPPANQAKLVDPADTTADLGARARSYLQANCAHCHVPAGGGNAAIDLHINTAVADTRLLDRKPLHDSFGVPDARLVAPGAPERSVLLHRLVTTGRGRMPPLGSSVVDEPAVQLFRDWIRTVKAPVFTVSARVAADAPAANGKWLALTPNLEVWQNPSGWATAGEVSIDPANPRQLRYSSSAASFLVTKPGRSGNLVTKEKFGDQEVHVEFLIPKGSNSGVKFLGVYEIQIYDSFGKKEPTASDCGGVYPRAELRPRYHHIDKGIPPRVNAARPAGEWQILDATFLAPRFDAAGKKTANARLVKAVLNGQLIHENVELKTPTGHVWRNPEAATGPLLLQGDHGPVAFRNVRIRAYTGPAAKP